MIYALGFDGVLAERKPTGGLGWVLYAEDGLRKLLDAEHEVIVWSVRMGPAASPVHREELRAFLAPMLKRYGNLRIATAEQDGPKPLADVFVDEKCERFSRRTYPGSGLSWGSLVASAVMPRSK